MDNHLIAVLPQGTFCLDARGHEGRASSREVNGGMFASGTRQWFAVVRGLATGHGVWQVVVARGSSNTGLNRRSRGLFRHLLAFWTSWRSGFNRGTC